MDRANAFTIEVTDWLNSDLWQVLSEATGEDCLFDQPDFKKDGIFWLKKVPKLLFKFEGCFNWLSGSSKLWYKGNPVTCSNYKMVISDEEAEIVEYNYINYYKMTPIAPIIEDEFKS